MTLKEAYDTWVHLQPIQIWIKGDYKTIWFKGHQKVVYIPKHFEGNCCNKSHVYRVYEGFSSREELRPYSEVCARERAWRTYICIRDGLN